MTNTLATIVFAVLTTGCATVPVTQPLPTAPAAPPSLRNMAPPDAVLELIQRVMKAAKAGVMANEDLALKTLGLILVPSTKPGGTRQIITGIAALDDDKEVRVYYGVNRDPARPYKWQFSIRSFGTLVCVTKESADLVASNFGANTGMDFGRHEGDGFGGRHFYTIFGDTDKTSATFTYWRRGAGRRCLDDFSAIHSTR